MRLKKLSLVAAAGLAATSLFAASADIDGSSVSLSSNIDVGFGQTLTITNDDAFTFSNKITGAGNVVKTGAGTMQIDSYSNITYYNGNTFKSGSPTYLSDANRGTLTVESGRVAVSGYLAQYVGGLQTSSPPAPYYAGFSSVVLRNNAVLDFSQTQRNIATGFANYDGHDDTNLPTSKQFNTVVNLNGSVDTRLNTGSSDIRLLVAMTAGQQGGIGSITGSGQIAFSGEGFIGSSTLSTFTIRNDSTFDGVVYMAGGVVELASVNGGSLANIHSVNFGGVTGWAYDHATVEGEWMPNYIPSAFSSVLNVQGSQRINNLQALFSRTTPPTPYEDMYLSSQGATGTINLVSGTTLTINQTLNGYFRGNFTDLSDLSDETSHTGGGDVIKNGAGTLVLMPESSNIFKTLSIREGGVISTVQGLGRGIVNVSSGASLVFVQNNPGNLEAELRGDLGSTLSFQKVSSIKNIDGLDVQVSFYGVVEIGSVNVLVSQTEFKGVVFVKDGMTLLFNAASGDAFANASGIVLKAGSNGEETKLTFADTNQTFRNLSGDAGTKVDLGRGTITLVQDAKDANGDFVSSSYSGKIVGAGGLVKTGGGTFELDGRDELGASVNTYYGATTVKAGALSLAGVKQLPNTSGLILLRTYEYNADGSLKLVDGNPVVASGTVVAKGSQTFGALFGTAGTVLDMGAGTLTIGRTAAEVAALRAQESVPGARSTAGFYLGTLAVDPASVSGATYNDAATRTYLASVSTKTNADGTVVRVSDADAAALTDLAFAGEIKGSGAVRTVAVLDANGDVKLVNGVAETKSVEVSLVKIGDEILSLTGVNSYTGATLVQGGTLRIKADSIAQSSFVRVDAGAKLALDGTGTFDQIVEGKGSFEKVGSGELTLGSKVTLTGDYTISAGKLNLSAAGAFAGNVIVRSGATINYDSAGDSTLAGTVTGAGTLEKSGTGSLTLTNPTGITGFAGNVQVDGGTLVTPGIAPGAIMIASGATYRANLSGATSYNGALSGAGILAVNGGSLSVGQANSGFTGTLAVSSTTLTGVSGMIAGDVTLTKSTFAVGSTTQNLSGLSGDADSRITLSGGTLNFVIDGAHSGVFAGTISGTGNLTKSGAGTLELSSLVSSSWTSGNVTVDGGTLVATPAVLGGTQVTVNSAGTFALSNPDPVNSRDYANNLIGTGILDKRGVGSVRLTGASAGFTGNVQVTEGTLIVANGALINAGTGAGATVKVARNAVYQVNDVDVGAARAALVTGEGSFALSGANTLTLGAQNYTGNTILLNGARLDLTGPGFTGTLNGLAGDSTATVLSGTSLVINQNTAGAFQGVFSGVTDLTVTGSAKLTLSPTAVGAVTVDGGKLVLDSSSATVVTLANGGALHFTGTSPYAANLISGTGDVIKSGSAAVTLSAAQTAAYANVGRLGVDNGRLTLDVASLGSNITGLTTEGSGSTLALNVASGSAGYSRALSGSGNLEKSGAGKLVLGVAGVNSASNPYQVGSIGTFTVAAGTLGGTFRTVGDLVVASGATLAPGYSPGVASVGGDFTLASGSTLEIEINGVAADKVVVTGAAILAGNLHVKQDATPGATRAARRQTFEILKTGGGISGAFANADANGVVQLSAADIAASGVARVRLAKTDANTLTMTTVTALDSTPGFRPHDGIGALVERLNLGTAAGGVPATVLAAVDATDADGLSRAVNALSPLGFASLYAMERDTASGHESRLRERLEQRRYDQGGYSPYEWEAFVVGAGAMADNKDAVDTPTFDTRTYGGLVGLDTRLENGPVVGGAVGYDNGNATLHGGAGKVEMNRVRATGFLSSKLTNRWFLDAGLSAGFGDFNTKRETVTGRATGSTTGVDFGANVATGTIVTLTRELHLTPFAALSYAHYEFQGFDEEGGNGAALKVDGWSNDSLRASLGTGLGWWIPSGDWKWKLGVDVAYNRELLDTDSKIDARFASGGSSFGTTAAALPSDTLSVSPSAALHFDENNSLSAGLNLEYGFDGRAYTGFNVAFRRRF